MAGLNCVPAPPTIGEGGGRKLLGGFGGATPIQARGGDKIPADLYGLHQEEIQAAGGHTRRGVDSAC